MDELEVAFEKAVEEFKDISPEEAEEQADEEWRRHFTIEDDQTAEWCMEQIRDAQKEKAKWKEFYDARYRAVCASADRTIANMESVLQAYFERVPHKVTPTQENYALPSGKLVIKRQEPEYKRDDHEVVEWLKANANGKYIKETLDWSGLKKTINVLGNAVADEDGQVIPCIEVIERPDIFKVELKKEDK